MRTEQKLKNEEDLSQDITGGQEVAFLLEGEDE